MAIVHSITKGLAAMVMALARSRGWLDARDLEAPSGGGVGTARAIAKAYGVFATGGKELGLRPETIEALSASAIPARHGFFEEPRAGEVLARLHEAK
jgi:hypothetical protein